MNEPRATRYQRRRRRARVAGLCSGLSALTLVVGEILQRTGSYVGVFLIAGFMYLFALLVIHLLVPRLAPARID